MLIPSRAFGFIRSGLNGRFGVTVPNFGTGGTDGNPLDNDVDAGDEAAGVEFCPVFAAQPSSGTLTVWTDGALSLVGAADGTYALPYSLYTFTSGGSASAEADGSPTTYTVTVGAAAVQSVLAATGGSGTLSAASTVSPLAVFTAAGGSGALSAESTVASPGTVSSIFASTGGSGALAAASFVSPVVAAALSGGSGTLSAVSAALSTFVMPEAANLVREPAELRWVREPAETRFIAR